MIQVQPVTAAENAAAKRARPSRNARYNNAGACIICRKPVTLASYEVVRVNAAGDAILTLAEQEAEGGPPSYAMIGAGCRRKLAPEYR